MTTGIPWEGTLPKSMLVTVAEKVICVIASFRTNVAVPKDTGLRVRLSSSLGTAAGFSWAFVRLATRMVSARATPERVVIKSTARATVTATENSRIRSRSIVSSLLVAVSQTAVVSELRHLQVGILQSWMTGCESMPHSHEGQRKRCDFLD